MSKRGRGFVLQATPPSILPSPSTFSPIQSPFPVGGAPQAPPPPSAVPAQAPPSTPCLSRSQSAAGPPPEGAGLRWATASFPLSHAPLSLSPAHLQGPQAAPHFLLVAQRVGGGQQEQQGQQAAWSRDARSRDRTWGQLTPLGFGHVTRNSPRLCGSNSSSSLQAPSSSSSTARSATPTSGLREEGAGPNADTGGEALPATREQCLEEERNPDVGGASRQGFTYGAWLRDGGGVVSWLSGRGLREGAWRCVKVGVAYQKSSWGTIGSAHHASFPPARRGLN